MCAIDYCDERFETYRLQDIGRARKSHGCDECHRAIAVGEPYLYAFGVYEGRGESYYICQHCRVAANWLRENCGGFLHCGVWEDIDEHVETYRDLRRGLHRYRIGMRRMWQRFDRTGLMRVPPMAKPIKAHHG